MNLLIAFAILFGVHQQNTPADTLSLQYCYNQVMEEYPVASTIDLQKKITELNVKIAHTGYYPRIGVSGKATYQSEVTEFSLPGGAGPPAVSKDQYEAALNITQNIYNGGAIGIRKELERVRGEQAVHSVETDLHQVRAQVDQVYFGILLSQQQLQQNALMRENLNERLSNVRSGVENGVLLSSQQHILEAELIRARQDSAEIESNIRAGFAVLSELTGEELSPNTALKVPVVTKEVESLNPVRPELALFASNVKALEYQEDLAGTKRLPSISAFANAAYGRPGLNFLNDDFHDYYIVGINLKWNLLDFLNAGDEQQAIRIQQQQIRENENAFNIQLSASLKRIRERMDQIEENIQRDEQIITLRESVVDESASQLENGVITATEYITELNQLNGAQLSLSVNRIRLVQAQIDYATALGVTLSEISLTD